MATHSDGVPRRVSPASVHKHCWQQRALLRWYQAAGQRDQRAMEHIWTGRTRGEPRHVSQEMPGRLPPVTTRCPRPAPIRRARRLPARLTHTNWHAASSTGLAILQLCPHPSLRVSQALFAPAPIEVHRDRQASDDDLCGPGPLGSGREQIRGGPADRSVRRRRRPLAPQQTPTALRERSTADGDLSSSAAQWVPR